MSIPPYSLFRTSCERGLSVVRPLSQEARTWDEFGWNFGSAWPPSYEAFGRMRALWTLRQAVALNPRRALEVAAGDGSLSASLAARGVDVVANDLRADHLVEAIRSFSNGGKIRVLPGNLFELDPEQIGRFDLVIACEVIEHVAHPDHFLAQLSQFVAPGGHILLTTPNGSYFRNRLPGLSEIEDRARLEAIQFKPDADGHLFLIKSVELKSLAAQAQMQVDHLDLYATPLITGHCRLSLIRSAKLTRFCYWFEALFQHCPDALRERLCFLMSVVLSKAQPKSHA